jgi:hypothetical protein
MSTAPLHSQNTEPVGFPFLEQTHLVLPTAHKPIVWQVAGAIFFLLAALGILSNTFQYEAPGYWYLLMIAFFVACAICIGWAIHRSEG